MKRKLLTAVGALLLATGLPSCYVYDDPLTWGAPYRSPVYNPGFYPRPVVYPVRSYGYNNYRSFSPRFSSHSHCAPPPPSCGPRGFGGGGFGGRGWR